MPSTSLHPFSAEISSQFPSISLSNQLQSSSNIDMCPQDCTSPSSPTHTTSCDLSTPPNLKISNDTREPVPVQRQGLLQTLAFLNQSGEMISTDLSPISLSDSTHTSSNRQSEKFSPLSIVSVNLSASSGIRFLRDAPPASGLYEQRNSNSIGHECRIRNSLISSTNYLPPSFGPLLAYCDESGEVAVLQSSSQIDSTPNSSSRPSDQFSSLTPVSDVSSMTTFEMLAQSHSPMTGSNTTTLTVLKRIPPTPGDGSSSPNSSEPLSSLVATEQSTLEVLQQFCLWQQSGQLNTLECFNSMLPCSTGDTDIESLQLESSNNSNQQKYQSKCKVKLSDNQFHAVKSKEMHEVQRWCTPTQHQVISERGEPGNAFENSEPFSVKSNDGLNRFVSFSRNGDSPANLGMLLSPNSCKMLMEKLPMTSCNDDSEFMDVLCEPPHGPSPTPKTATEQTFYSLSNDMPVEQNVGLACFFL